MNTALQRAIELLADPPSNPDISKGYLDLLGSVPATDADPPKNTGPIQAAWASPIGSMLYDRAQALARRLMTVWQHPAEWLDIPRGGTALDVGSGPGNVTASLARAAGPDGLALGVDVCEPRLAGAVGGEAGSIAMLQLIPKPSAALAEMARVLRPGARMAVMVPAAGAAGALMRLLPDGGAYFFTEDEIGDILEDLGLVGVRTKSLATIQWVRGKRP